MYFAIVSLRPKDKVSKRPSIAVEAQCTSVPTTAGMVPLARTRTRTVALAAAVEAVG